MSSTTGTTKILSIEDQPLASRVSTPVGGNPHTHDAVGGGRPISLIQQSPRAAQGHSQHQSQAQQGVQNGGYAPANHYQQSPIEMNINITHSQDPKLALAH